MCYKSSPKTCCLSPRILSPVLSFFSSKRIVRLFTFGSQNTSLFLTLKSFTVQGFYIKQIMLNVLSVSFLENNQQTSEIIIDCEWQRKTNRLLITMYTSLFCVRAGGRERGEALRIGVSAAVQFFQMRSPTSFQFHKWQKRFRAKTGISPIICA